MLFMCLSVGRLLLRVFFFISVCFLLDNDLLYFDSTNEMQQHTTAQMRVSVQLISMIVALIMLHVSVACALFVNANICM